MIRLTCTSNLFQDEDTNSFLVNYVSAKGEVQIRNTTNDLRMINWQLWLELTQQQGVSSSQVYGER